MGEKHGNICTIGKEKEQVCFLKIDVMGVLFDNVTMEQALDRAET